MANKCVLSNTFGYTLILILSSINSDSQTYFITLFSFIAFFDIKKIAYQNYLNRNLSPKIKFDFYEEYIDNKKIVVLVIEAANDVPTSFNGERFIRIGSSKASMKDNPKLEKALFKILETGYPTITNTSSQFQDLSFEKLFMYYGSKGIELRKETFKKNLQLLTEDGKYNILAQLLSDNSHLPLRLSIFEGETKGSNLYAIKEFGFDCILYSLKNLIDFH